MAVSGAHGAISTLGNMNYGIEINLKKLNSVTIADDGKTAKIGGGALSKTVVDDLWAAGKQTGECDRFAKKISSAMLTPLSKSPARVSVPAF